MSRSRFWIWIQATVFRKIVLTPMEFGIIRNLAHDPTDTIAWQWHMEKIARKIKGTSYLHVNRYDRKPTIDWSGLSGALLERNFWRRKFIMGR